MPHLLQHLQSQLDARSGSLPFDEFMRIALHHPDGGYYASTIRGIGRAGDFTTTPKLSPCLGQAIASWIRREMNCRHWKHCAVIECGPGDGSLAAQVMKSLGWFERRRIKLHLVESSTPLRAQQKSKLARFHPHWHSDISSALDACDGRALIFHNEFFDAFPCRVFRFDEQDWSELYLKVSDRRLTEEFLAPSRPLPNSTALTRSWELGQRVEIFESVNIWLRELASSWSEGSMLAVDYGDSTDRIYHRRRQGTLRAYRDQQCLTREAVYELPGRQDITADMNFSDIALWATQQGLNPHPDDSLATFIHSPDPHLAAASQAFRWLIIEKSV